MTDQDWALMRCPCGQLFQSYCGFYIHSWVKSDSLSLLSLDAFDKFLPIWRSTKYILDINLSFKAHPNICWKIIISFHELWETIIQLRRLSFHFSLPIGSTRFCYEPLVGLQYHGCSFLFRIRIIKWIFCVLWTCQLSM